MPILINLLKGSAKQGAKQGAKEVAKRAIINQAAKKTIRKALTSEEKFLRVIQPEIKRRILERLRYGSRVETAIKPSRVASWSNNSGWYVTHRHVKKGESIELDANDILIPNDQVRKVDQWFKQGDAPPLPLALGSFERTKLMQKMKNEELLPEFVAERTKQLNPEIRTFEEAGQAQQHIEKLKLIEERAKAIRRRREGLHIVEPE